MIKPYLIYVGNLYPHKNISILIRAAETLRVNLAIVCTRSVFADRIGKSKYVHFLGSVSDTELKKLYAESVAFVFPSLIEGFGLPGLEAMASNCPVIAARASCLPEIYGEAALYFDPHDVDDLISKIKLIMSDNKLRSSLISKGRVQVEKYSWAKMTSQTWQIYQNILSS